jgi:FeS assembly SUF system protein
MSQEQEQTEVLQIETDIVKTLKNIYDPEIPVNIYDLGLIYDILIDDEKKVKIVMTLTAPNCPVADDLLLEVKTKVMEVTGVKETEVSLVFEPSWDQTMMSEEALLELGML